MDIHFIKQMEESIATKIKLPSNKVKLLMLPKSEHIYFIVYDDFECTEEISDFMDEIRSKIEEYGWFMTDILINPEVYNEPK